MDVKNSHTLTALAPSQKEGAQLLLPRKINAAHMAHQKARRSEGRILSAVTDTPHNDKKEPQAKVMFPALTLQKLPMHRTILFM